ncbi:MAG TPA: hypothetical protein VFG76_11540, partial [Candidatus Polarisedimenticolia bacterium]|nr:hypothetical protein [Candidatus Polarisedimenticolia bacterium]
MDPLTLASLEFDALKGLIEPFLRTPMGRRALQDLLPTDVASVVEARKRRSAEALDHHLEGGRLGSGGLDDPDPILARLEPRGAILDPNEIARLISVILAGQTAREGLASTRDRYPRLWEVAVAIPDLGGLTRPIAGKISAEGRVEDSASPDLGRIRRKIVDLEARLQRLLQQIVDAGAERGALQDAYVTIRNGRFVIPVRAEAKAAMPGVVHGASSTGATVFVEPMQTLETNNELVTLRDEETAEVRRILAAWSESLRARLPEIARTCVTLGEIDLLGAIAAFGVLHRCAVAGGADGAGGESLVLLDARHPILEAGLRSKGMTPVPMTIEMPGAGGVLVLSGPNAGGKTVALKTIGLLALMNQAGLPLPSRDARLPIYRQVLADIGDHQSILESLSTFSARMVRVAQMSRLFEAPALVLLDEVGAGTDPEEAGALGVAIVDHFRKRGASVISTTHHEALKAYASTAPGSLNASMEIDAATMRPTFRLVTGVTGLSGGVDLAARVGLPEEVVADARSRLSSGHREALQYTAQLQEMSESIRREEELARVRREELEAERAKLRGAVDDEIAALKRTWREAIDAALGRIEAAREELIAGIRDRTAALQIRAESRRQAATLKEQLESALAPPIPERGAADSPSTGAG